MGVILQLEALFKELEALMPIIDALPLSPELASLRAKIDSVMNVLKVAGL